jgi:hypothetical protein
MSKEEKSYIENMVIVLQTLVDNYTTSDEHGGYPKEGYIYVKNILDKILSLPQRTIGTLEVGDLVIYKDKVGNNEALFINNFFNQFQARYIGSNLVYIIPHESLDLLKQILGGECDE